jgi:pyruvate,water dikinase
MSEETVKEIKRKYKDLCEGEKIFVAVRSSATAEDLPTASFAGQQETFLNIKGEDNLLDAVKKCWASLYGARAIFYRVKGGFEHSKVNIAVIVQKMVDSEKAGVLFTSHPTTGEPLAIVESAWGLGEAVVSGTVSPDNFVVDRKNLKILDEKINEKAKMFSKDPKTGDTKIFKVPEEKRNISSLTKEEVIELVRYGNLIEELYKFPQDVEWGITGGKIYILQSRAITTINKVVKETKKKEGIEEPILRGTGASPGVISSRVKIIQKLDDINEVKEGDIMVTKMTSPDMVPAMRRAAGIVTNEGGLTCHAAIVSRELGAPCIVGTKEATKVLRDGMIITMDGKKGMVYEGEMEKKEVEEEEKATPFYNPITATEVKVNISIPKVAERAAKTGADGVGLLRIEHLVLSLPMHPQKYIEDGMEDEYVKELVKGIKKVADAFYPKSVWVRTIDAPTDEFRSMPGGEDEPTEANPMLGWRGIRRDLTIREHFKLEMEAFKKLFELGYDNVGIMLPLIQHPNEIKAAKEMMREVGLDIEKMECGIMVETPASALIIEDIIEEGIDFVSFGTNDLTQYTLAVDRNNENVAEIFDEMHPAILKLMKYVIERCNEADVKTSICGQAGSYPKMVEKLVEYGISSVSSNIDAVSSIRETVARKEMQMMLGYMRNNEKNR